MIYVKAARRGFSDTTSRKASEPADRLRESAMIREIVTIDENLCDGCGECIPACHEGALQIVNGKAKLVSDRLCDGLGACLGHCPRGAIRIERRDADGFDEALVAARPHTPVAVAAPQTAESHPPAHAGHGGCPGSRFFNFEPKTRRPADEAAAQPAAASELTHWPVQLRLLSPQAPVLNGARLLVAADCVPVAFAGFHEKLLRGRAVVIGCPKFDDLELYVQRLAEMIRRNTLAEIVVARMEVPCCTGIVAAVLEARRVAGVDVPVREVVITAQGDIRCERELAAAVALH